MTINNGVVSTMNRQQAVESVAWLHYGKPLDELKDDDANHCRGLVGAVIAALRDESVPALEVFRIAGGDVECNPNPTADQALECLRDLRKCYGEALRDEAGEAEPPENEIWPPDGAVWLAPVATDPPANPKLMQYAWGRSNLSTGQMAEAYQCIVSAAQECGQVYRLPCTHPAPQQPEQPAGKGECKTCAGRGEIGGHVGQTPESSEWRGEPCPDCHPNGRDMTEIDAAIAAMKDKPGEKVRGLVDELTKLRNLYAGDDPSDEPPNEFDKGYEQACAEFVQHLDPILEAALSAKGDNEDTTHER